MDIRDAAKLFRAWSAHEGMFAGDQVFPTPSAAEVALITGITPQGRDTLRAKQIQAVGVNEADEVVIAYFVRSAKISQKALALLPSAVDGYPITYAQGMVEAVDTKAAEPFGTPYFLRQVGQGQFYTCGSSISVGNVCEAGTLGAIVKDGAGKLFGISNNHVSGSCSQAPIGMPIVAPGIADVGANNHPPFTIGFHAGALPLLTGDVALVDYKKNSDFAYFEINDPAKISSFQQDEYDTPASILPIAGGMEVMKVGRTTGLKRGKVVSELLGPFPIPYSSESYGFSGTVYFDSLYIVDGINSERFSEGGDSGSLVVHKDAAGDLHAVGLMLAGLSSSNASGGSFTLVLPIEPILASLGMTLVSGLNT
ncbi:hypothetical protein [Stenotrophomonas indicatrix]|uniref:hypothetical protein n=1 Tax=Stenotrophomonas indicatrix TaxID=2045451 RepID=UPI0028A60D49|nr:hypothetical protein [Stenotrophomonas indicatrix]